MSERLVELAELLPVFEQQLAAGESVRFYPRGTSMMPMLRRGQDCVVLSPLPEQLKRYDLPLYRRADGQFVLHRIVKTGQTFTCIGDNQFVFEYGVKREQMIGLVTAFVRNGRETAVTHPTYRLYCRLWHYSRPVRRLWRRAVAVLARLTRPLRRAVSGKVKESKE